MLRFKKYLEERMAKFVAMPPGEFAKLNSQTGEKRIDILRRLMKNGEAMPTVDGVEIVIKNTPENKEAIDRLEKEKKAQKLDTSKGEIVTSKIGKSNVFGGGGGGSGGGSKQTADAESLQCLYCEFMVNNPRAKFEEIQPSDLEKTFGKVSVGGTSREDAIALDPSWHYSSFWTAKELLRKNYINSKMTFHRDDKLMKAVYAKKNEALKNSGMAKLSDDKWNPGDIWATTSPSIVSDLPTTSIQELNATLVKLFKERKLIGISLKKVLNFDRIKCEIINEEPSAEIHKFKDGRLMASFARKASEFWRSKSGVVEFEGGKADLRTSSQFAAINFEITLKTARGGRAGYSQIIESLRKRAGKRVPDNAQLKKIAIELNQKGEASRYANVFFNMAKKVHPSLQKDEFMKGLVESKAHEVHSKMGATYVLSCLFENKNKAAKGLNHSIGDLIITDLVNYAGSTLDISSIYAKVYQ
jgi:hypothetical protein